MGTGAEDKGLCHTGQCSPSPPTFSPLGSLLGCCALLPYTQRCWALPLLGDFRWYSQAFLHLGEGPVEGQTWLGSTGPDSTKHPNP